MAAAEAEAASEADSWWTYACAVPDRAPFGNTRASSQNASETLERFSSGGVRIFAFLEGSLVSRTQSRSGCEYRALSLAYHLEEEYPGKSASSESHKRDLRLKTHTVITKSARSPRCV